MNLNKILKEIIDKKYSHLGLDKVNKDHIFWKHHFIGSNSLGSVGVEFIIKLFNENNIEINNKKRNRFSVKDMIIDVKTAKMSKGNSFQFNYSNKLNGKKCDYFIFLGISNNNIYWKVVNREDDISGDHIVINEELHGISNMNKDGKNLKKINISKNLLNDSKEIEDFIELIKNK